MYLICGEALYDVFLRDEEGPGALRLEARAGGSPFNVAIGVARRGGRAALLTGLSTDMLGRRLAELLESEGVETRYLIRTGRRTTLSLVDLAADGSPEYAFYGVGSADTALTEADLPTLGPEVTGLHFGSYSIVAAPIADALATLAASADGRFISLDPNVRPTVAPDLDAWRARIDAMVARADLVKVSTEDLSILYGEADPATLAQTWLDRGVALVVVTDGAQTVTGYAPEMRVDVAPPDAMVVDTVGAGDAFQATLLTELGAQGAPKEAVRNLSPASLKQLLQSSAAVASATCEVRGADIPRLTTQ